MSRNVMGFIYRIESFIYRILRRNKGKTYFKMSWVTSDISSNREISSMDV